MESNDPSEKQIQNAIFQYLATRRDLRCWRQNVGKAVPVGVVHKAVRLIQAGDIAGGLGALNRGIMAFGVNGMADIGGIWQGPRDNWMDELCDPDGVRLEIEVKSETGKQSPEQVKYQAMIERFGGRYILARSVEDVDDGLR